MNEKTERFLRVLDRERHNRPLLRAAVNYLKNPDDAGTLARLAPSNLLDDPVGLLCLGLYELAPIDSRNAENLGASLKKLQSSRTSETLERRLRRILESEREELRNILPALFQFLGSSKVAVDYAQLHEDLTYWSSEITFRKKAWLEAFYREAE